MRLLSRPEMASTEETPPSTRPSSAASTATSNSGPPHRSTSMDSIHGGGTAEKPSGEEHIPTRMCRANPKVNVTANLQFIKTGPAALHKSAAEQIKKAETIKALRKTSLQEEEEWQATSASTTTTSTLNNDDWQSNLDKWKSNRRKRNEDVLERVIEVKRNEKEEEEYGRQRRKSKTFSEMREDKNKRGRRYNLVVHNDNDNDFSDLGLSSSSKEGENEMNESYKSSPLIQDKDGKDGYDSKDTKSDPGFCTGSDTGSDGVFNPDDNISDTSSALKNSQTTSEGSEAKFDDDSLQLHTEHDSQQHTASQEETDCESTKYKTSSYFPGSTVNDIQMLHDLQMNDFMRPDVPKFGMERNEEGMGDTESVGRQRNEKATYLGYGNHYNEVDDDDDFASDGEQFGDDDIDEVIEPYEQLSKATSSMPNSQFPSSESSDEQRSNIIGYSTMDTKQIGSVHGMMENVYENIHDEEPMYENIYEKEPQDPHSLIDSESLTETSDHHYQTLEDVRSEVFDTLANNDNEEPPPVPTSSIPILNKSSFSHRSIEVLDWDDAEPASPSLPPSVPPPPPPSGGEDDLDSKDFCSLAEVKDNQQESSSLNTSTDSVKREIRQKMSDFLGITPLVNSEENDVSMIQSPPNANELLRQERESERKAVQKQTNANRTKWENELDSLTGGGQRTKYTWEDRMRADTDNHGEKDDSGDQFAFQDKLAELEQEMENHDRGILNRILPLNESSVKEILPNSASYSNSHQDHEYENGSRNIITNGHLPSNCNGNSYNEAEGVSKLNGYLVTTGDDLESNLNNFGISQKDFVSAPIKNQSFEHLPAPQHAMTTHAVPGIPPPPIQKTKSDLPIQEFYTAPTYNNMSQSPNQSVDYNHQLSDGKNYQNKPEMIDYNTSKQLQGKSNIAQIETNEQSAGSQLSKQSLMALSALPKPKLAQNESWIKRKEVKKDYSKHWLLQEAEQRRLESQDFNIVRSKDASASVKLPTSANYTSHFNNMKSNFNSSTDASPPVGIVSNPAYGHPERLRTNSSSGVYGSHEKIPASSGAYGSQDVLPTHSGVFGSPEKLNTLHGVYESHEKLNTLPNIAASHDKPNSSTQTKSFATPSEIMVQKNAANKFKSLQPQSNGSVAPSGTSTWKKQGTTHQHVSSNTNQQSSSQKSLPDSIINTITQRVTTKQKGNNGRPSSSNMPTNKGPSPNRTHDDDYHDYMNAENITTSSGPPGYTPSPPMGYVTPPIGYATSSNASYSFENQSNNSNNINHSGSVTYSFENQTAHTNISSAINNNGSTSNLTSNRVNSSATYENNHNFATNLHGSDTLHKSNESLPQMPSSNASPGNTSNNTSTASSTTAEDQRLLSVSGKKKCSHCGEELGRGAAMIIESLRLFYHIPCFKCCVCSIQLGNGTAGADVRVRNHKLHCHNCYSNDEGMKFSKV